MKITNFDALSTTPLRSAALKIAEAGLQAVDTKTVIKKSVSFRNGRLSVLGRDFNLSAAGKLIVIAVGKCAIDASMELQNILGDAITGGAVLDVRENNLCRFEKIECLVGSHPIPSEANVDATQKILEKLSGLTQNDLVLFVISGGGSTLLCLPEAGKTCVDEKLIVEELLKSGATIQEINTIRKHMSLARGGFLAKEAFPAQAVSLIFSDVPGNDLGFVASGPTMKDQTTIAEADRIMAKYNVLRTCGIEHCGLIETPKDDKYFSNVYNVVVASNDLALEAMAQKAVEQAFKVQIKSAALTGEAKIVGKQISAEINRAPSGSVYLYGGETTVKVIGLGRGGRNQELVLGSLVGLTTDTSVISIASDGKDNGPYAGAIADTETAKKASIRNLSPDKFLAENDSSNFFEQTQDLIITNDTGSNVSDLIIAIKNQNNKNMDSNQKAADEKMLPRIDGPELTEAKHILWMEEVGIADVPEVGGKNASLGEMISNLASLGVRVPSGFIVTAGAYRHFLQKTGLDVFIKQTLTGLDTSNLRDLDKRAKAVREAIVKQELPDDLKEGIRKAYAKMEKRYGQNIDTAVRSSATAEDLPGASFAGEHDTYLGIRGAERVIKATKSAMASLFTARAISYRVDKGFDHFKVALSVGVQQMVRSDKGCSGVMFTLDTESGFKDTVIINGSWGLGEMIVQGKVTPDEFIVSKKTAQTAPDPVVSRARGSKLVKMIYGEGGSNLIKPTKVIKTSVREQNTFVLTNAEVKQLALWGMIIEDHYTKVHGKWTPMDTEWAKDGQTGELYIVQARPETIHAGRDFSKIRDYEMKQQGKEIVRGASVGSKIATGKARVILSAKNIGQFKSGEILVTDMTDPDWEPIMKIASAIVTDKGGRTSHAAIVSRELGIPAVVGSGNATKKIKTGQMLTVDTSGSDGLVFEGALKFEITEHDVKDIPKTKTKIMMNIATPDTAFEKSFLPNGGVGLAREEFIIAGAIGIHPLALLNFKKLAKPLQKKIEAKTAGWSDKAEFYVDNLAYGIAKIGVAFFPKPVIVRFSDFKTNEYRTLLGGEAYEPDEENPMIGWRGASRYYDQKFAEAFKLEVLALKKVREEMGLTNVIPMIPFCRTPEEGQQTLEIMKAGGLAPRSLGGEVPVYVMCEIPSNVLSAEEFLKIFDGMSIGSNDLTQLVLGLDRDSGIVSHVGDERNPAVKEMIKEIIKVCLAKKKYIGICGQGPSDHPDFAEFLVREGIESMSLNPDTVVKTTLAVAELEQNLSQK